MKKTKTVFYILMFLPLAVTIVALFFLPDRIPAHYGFDGSVDRYGSKYEALILPVVTIPFGFFLLAMGRLSSKAETNKNNNNEKVAVVAGMLGLLVFNVMAYYFLYADFKNVQNIYTPPSLSLSLYQIVFSLLGIVLIVIGNIMPKLKRNSIAGLRTKWSLSSDSAWRKSQKFGGVSFIIAGALLLIGNSLIFKGFDTAYFTMAVIITDTIICIIYSYKVAQAEAEAETKQE